MRRIELSIDSLAFGGDAVGREPSGRVVLVAGGAPGDRLEVELDEERPRLARGRAVRVITAGGARATPRCPLFGACGGCQWQEVALAAQREAKRAIVARALEPLGTVVGEAIAAAPPFGYRTRARLTAHGGGLGYHARRSHAVVDVPSCPLLHPALDGALALARQALAAALPDGAEVAFLVGRGGAVHLAVAPPERAKLAPAARAAARALVGATGEGFAIAGCALPGERVGAPSIDTSEEGDPAPFHAAADGFAQASAEGNRALRAAVERACDATGKRVLELHAGDGNFTRDLARRARSVEAVEGDPAAAGRLSKNAPTASARAEPIERAVERLARAGARFDLALVDPPRAGLPRAVAEALPALAPRLVYVSCDPMTLARDARILAGHGLHPARAEVLDLMPQTYHVEVVCTFTGA